MEEHEQLWSVDSLANYLRMHPVTIRRYIKEGKFDASLIGTRYLVHNDSVVAYVKSQNGKRSKAGRPRKGETKNKNYSGGL